MFLPFYVIYFCLFSFVFLFLFCLRVQIGEGHLGTVFFCHGSHGTPRARGIWAPLRAKQSHVGGPLGVRPSLLLPPYSWTSQGGWLRTPPFFFMAVLSELGGTPKDVRSAWHQLGYQLFCRPWGARSVKAHDPRLVVVVYLRLVSATH